MAGCAQILFTARQEVRRCGRSTGHRTSASATHDPLLASEAGARTPGEGRGIRTP